MALLDKIAKRFGFQRIPQKKKDILPWSEVPERTTYEPVFGSSPPPWKSEDYLKMITGWVYACITAIADEVATIDFHLYRRTKKGIEEINDHELLDLLYKVNPYTTKFDHIWLTQVYLETVGEAPWLLDRGKSRKEKPKAIYLLRPDRLTIVPSKEKVIEKYIYEVSSGNKLEFSPEEVIFLKYPNPLKPFRGRGTLEAVEKTVDLDRYAEEWNLQFFFNAARPDAILTTEQKLTPEQRLSIKKQWEKAFRGIKKRAKLAILEAGLKYERMQLSQSDMDFVEQQKFSRDKIFSILRVPKSIVAISDDVNRANAETHAYAFARWTIRPKMKRIVEQLNEFLVPIYGEDLYLDFADPVPENVELKIKKYSRALGESGWMTINEVRELEGLPPVTGGDAIYRPLSAISAAEKEKKYLSLPVKKGAKRKKEFPREWIRLNARIKAEKQKEQIKKEIKSLIKHYLKKYKKNGTRIKSIKRNTK